MHVGLYLPRPESEICLLLRNLALHSNKAAIHRTWLLSTTFSAHVWLATCTASRANPLPDGEYLRLTASSNKSSRVWLKIHMPSPVTVLQKHFVGYQYQSAKAQFKSCLGSPAGQPVEFSGC